MNDSASIPVEAIAGDSSRSALTRIMSALANREWLIAAAVCCVLLALVAFAKTTDLQYQRGDSAIFFQTLENIADRGAPVSQVFANTQGFIDSHLSTATADQLKSDPLLPPAQAERNMMRFHAYYILYPIAVLNRFIPSNVVLLVLDAACFIGVLLLAYVFLRREGLPFAAAGLFCLLIVAHPAWAQGLFYGQFYPDRFFVFAGLAFMCLVHRQRSSRTALLLCAIAVSLINERAALTAGLFLLAYVALYWKRTNLDPYFKIGLGVAMLAYGEIMIKFVLANGQYGGFLPSTLGGAVREFHDPVFVQKTLMLAVVSAAFLLVALFNVRGALIAALLMFPNIFGNIGGAEKVGWASHYPSYYLPSLIWAAMLGYRAAYARLAGRGLPAFYACASVAVLFVACIGTDTFYPISISPANLTKAFPFNLQRDVAFDMSPAGAQTRSMTNAIRQSIPQGATVTTVEEGMPILYRARTLRLLPVGVDSADYAVMYFSRLGNQPITYFGVVNFLGKQELDKINADLVSRMKRDGYDFKNAEYFPAKAPSGIAVVKRR